MWRSEKKELPQDEKSRKEKSTPRPRYQIAEPGAPSALLWFANETKVYSFDRDRILEKIGALAGPPAEVRVHLGLIA